MAVGAGEQIQLVYASLCLLVQVGLVFLVVGKL